MDRLTEAICLAARAHDGQTDKAGEPYILHPLRVMQAVSPRARIVAVLHDFLEDTDDEITVELSSHEWAALGLLTRPRSVEYDLYVANCGLHPLAREVKIADLRDNLSRPDSLPDGLRNRYEKALAVLDPRPSSEGEE